MTVLARTLHHAMSDSEDCGSVTAANHLQLDVGRLTIPTIQSKLGPQRLRYFGPVKMPGGQRFVSDIEVHKLFVNVFDRATEPVSFSASGIHC